MGENDMLYFENAKDSFSSATSNWGEYSEEARFYHRFAQMIPDKIDVDTLVLAFKIAFRDADRKKQDTASFITLVPQYVRQCTSKEFAREFRKKYNSEVLGLTQEELPDVDYGYTEVSPDVIDISSKDRNDVLAALYNASTPVGTGLIKYDPTPWTRETAASYFEQCGEPGEDGSIGISYILGRPMYCRFTGDIVDARNYNQFIEEGLAQRAIATCPNIEKKKSI